MSKSYVGGVGGGMPATTKTRLQFFFESVLVRSCQYTLMITKLNLNGLNSETFLKSSPIYIG